MKKSLFILSLCLAACTAQKSPYASITDQTVRENFEFADQQTRILLAETEAILDVVSV